MKKFTKRDYINLIILSLFTMIIFIILTRGTHIYGSTTDWKDQHWILPEYFRNLFYSTGKLIPEFALNIGAGQNIFNFAYYGLLNPIILISYFLPFINMMNYMIWSTIIIVIISSILFYKFLKNNELSENICFIATFIFLTSAPLLLHSHRHIMFINYMPFLILGLIGIDKYYKEKKFYLITISTLLIILTSYYYSVSGIVVLGIYYIYKYLKNNPKFIFKDFTISLIKFAYFILLGILMAAVLLLPVLATILSGRSETTTNLNLLNLFIPNVDIGYILYDSYGIGLTSISIISLIAAYFYNKKSKKFLAIILTCIFCIPIFLYLLNGTLYLNAKALIPFLPLMCFLVGNIIKDIIKFNFNIKKISTILIIVIIISCFTNSNRVVVLFLLDSITIMTSIILYFKRKNKFIFYVPILIICVINCIATNFTDELYSIKDYQKDFDKNIETQIKNIIKNDKTFYRINNNINTLSTINKIYDKNYYQSSLYSSTYNGNYNNFYVNTFKNEIPYRNSVINSETKNLLYQIYMGEKYIITTAKPNLGYKEINENDKYKIYENTNALPIGYATNKILSKNEYDKLEYPYTIESLLNYIIIDDDETSTYETNLEEYNIQNIINSISKLNTPSKKNKYNLIFDKKTKITVPLEQPINNKILIISFDMKLSQDCAIGDTYITINGIKNKLTCNSWRYHNKNYSFEYVLSTENIKKLNITFSKGEFSINNIKAYTLDYNHIKNIQNNIDILNVDLQKSTDNKIYGDISVQNDGYFIFKVPYDNGFEIYIDDEKVEVLNVNDGFIGSKITKGNHKIEIVYHAPLLKLGKIISIIGLLMFIISIYINIKYEKIKEKITNNKLFKFLLKKYKQYEEIISYLFMGGCTTIVSIGSYTICSNLFHIHYQISNIISWIFAVTFAFITNKLFVFKVKNNNNLFKEIYQFIKFRILSLIIDMATMYILVDLLKINDLISKILVQIIVVILNYIFSKLFIFKKEK